MSSQPSSAAPAATAQPGVPDDPYRNYNFKFEVNGQVLAHFVQVEGLGFTVEPVPYTHLDVYKRQPGSPRTSW